MGYDFRIPERKEPKRHAIGYIRVSTGQQAGGDRFGVEAQREAIEAYAAENGYEVSDWRVDTESGASGERPELDGILYGDLGNSPAEAVIVFKNDRLARDTKLYFYYLYVLERRNIRLLSTREEFSEGDEFANIYRALLQFVAEQERKNITLRTERGRYEKARRGGYAGGKPPYGYRVEEGRLVPSETEAPAVREIFRLRDEGLSYTQICDRLYDAKYRTRKGTRLTPGGISAILGNERTYQGYYRYGRNGVYVKGVHEPLI